MSEHREGCLLGLLAGDRVGAAFEGQAHSSIVRRYPGLEELAAALKPGRPTAASLSALASARSLAAFPDFSGPDMAGRLVASYGSGLGFGRATSRAVERLCGGAEWNEAALETAGRSSFGNAAAVRMAAVGLLAGDDAENLRWIAEESSSITHKHVLATEGAVIQAHAVALASASRGQVLSASGYLEMLAGETPVREFRNRLEAAAGMVRTDTAAGKIIERLGNGTTALGSVVTAAYCFARKASSFEDAVVYAVFLGGNTTAIASMTGALAGAYLGAGGVPENWLDGADGDAVTAADMRRAACELPESV